MADSTPKQKKHRLSLSTWIVIGIVAGILTGLFFGEYAEAVKWIGDAYVGLLQMAVLPYVVFSLMVNVGRLSIDFGWRLLRVSSWVMALLWGMGFLTLAIMSFAFPLWETGSFFSSRFTEEPPDPRWIDLFIPSNPFRSLSENSIPAVVLFSIGIGIALMRLPNKERLIEPLEVLVDSLSGLNRLVVRLTPVGLFAIVAHTAGTLNPEQLSLIQGYLLTYGVSAILLSCIVLPGLVISTTSLTYQQVWRASREPLIGAFVIGNAFVVLPLIVEAVRQLQRELPNQSQAQERQAEYLVPLAYSFPDVGRIVGLIFLPFAAWFFGSVLDWEQIPALLGVGFLGSFGKPVITIPLLLDLAELPSDIFNLYLASGVVAARFGDLMKSMHLLVFSILVITVLTGNARVQRTKLLSSAAGSIALMMIAAFSIRGYLDLSFQDSYSKEQLVTKRELIFPASSTARAIRPTVLDSSSPNPYPIREGQNRVERIQESGVLRVGYDADKLPFAYFREGSRELIGFDIQMAYYLADDLGVQLEFVPIERGKLYEQLREDHFDVAMSAIEGNVKQASQIPSVDSYMEVTLALVVPDHAKSEFRTVEEIMEIPDLKLAVIRDSYFAERATKVLPSAASVVELDTAAEYFASVHEEVHGMVISAETGSAWTMREPKFTVANPMQGRVKVPLYYVTSDDRDFENFLQNWLTLKQSSGIYQDLYDYWILGDDRHIATPRWSIVRDVLGWVD